MTADEINGYLGLPWVAGARGPVAFDCWGLLRHIQNTHYGRRLPDVTLGQGGTAGEAYADRMQSGAWELTPQPFDGAGVLLRAGSDPHVGVWLDVDGGGVLHALEGVGVVFQAPQSLRMSGFGRMKFYRFNE